MKHSIKLTPTGTARLKADIDVAIAHVKLLIQCNDIVLSNNSAITTNLQDMIREIFISIQLIRLANNGPIPLGASKLQPLPYHILEASTSSMMDLINTSAYEVDHNNTILHNISWEFADRIMHAGDEIKSQVPINWYTTGIFGGFDCTSHYGPSEVNAAILLVNDASARPIKVRMAEGEVQFFLEALDELFCHIGYDHPMYQAYKIAVTAFRINDRSDEADDINKIADILRDVVRNSGIAIKEQLCQIVHDNKLLQGSNSTNRQLLNRLQTISGILSASIEYGDGTFITDDLGVVRQVISMRDDVIDCIPELTKLVDSLTSIPSAKLDQSLHNKCIRWMGSLISFVTKLASYELAIRYKSGSLGTPYTAIFKRYYRRIFGIVSEPSSYTLTNLRNINTDRPTLCLSAQELI